MLAIASIAVDRGVCEIADMQGAGDPTLINRLMAIKPDGLSFNAWALRAGVNRTIFNDVKKRGNIRHDQMADQAAADANAALKEAQHTQK